MKSEDKRATVKLDLTNRDILRFAKRVTGKNYNEFLRDFLESWILCASAYREFTYTINVHSPESFEVKFYGKPALISLSKKITSDLEAEEFERDSLAMVEKSTTFSNVANQISRTNKANQIAKNQRAKIIKRCK